MPLRDLIRFVEEDSPFGDITTSAIIPDSDCSAKIITRQDCVVAGLAEVIRLAIHYRISCFSCVSDGQVLAAGDTVLSWSGSAHAILLLERTALNLLGRMSGIATAARKTVEEVRTINPSCRVAVTRKTAPGLRVADKKAAIIGGAEPHRFSLSDAILIKDNHLALVSLPIAVECAVSFSPYRVVEVEVEDAESACIAAEQGAGIILLDNMDPAALQHTLDLLSARGLRDRVKVEISGGINPDSLSAYARLSIDIISLGFLTHSVSQVDMSLTILSPRDQ
ncbi:MAG: carboxylating nicotinate-nucleotide diphosphorylase [Methanospirillaceae archaeon]|nr:carboxylating nicotinate-nucleotide diphosphorylase [Methanospirillaceae archaeon]